MIAPWEDVIHTGIIGTDKKQVNKQLLPQALLPALEKIETVFPGKEEQFLSAASLVYAYRRGGFMPSNKPVPPLPACEQESRPYAGAAAMASLQAVLGDDSESLLYYWLLLCTRKAALVHPEFLPALLTLAETNTALQSMIMDVAGNRGAWLGNFNSKWKFIAATNYAELFETGKPEERRDALIAWRQQDAAGARQALMHVWSSEAAAVCADLLSLLETNLSKEDEIFLTEALKDKSQKVKDAALALLKQLPDSFVVNELWEFVKPLITLKKAGGLMGLLSKESLDIDLDFELPEHFSKTYGISTLDANKIYSEKEFTLEQLLGHIPPNRWETHLQLNAAQVLELFDKKKETSKFISGLAAGANTFKNVEWGLILYKKYRKICFSVVKNFDRSTQEEIALEPMIDNAHSLYNLLPGKEPEWSSQFTLDFLAKTCQDTYRYNRSFYKSVVHHFPPGIEPKLDSLLPGDDVKKNLWQNMTGEIKKLLALKQHITQSF